MCGRFFASWEVLCPHGPWLLVAVQTYPHFEVKLNFKLRLNFIYFNLLILVNTKYADRRDKLITARISWNVVIELRQPGIPV